MQINCLKSATILKDSVLASEIGGEGFGQNWEELGKKKGSRKDEHAR
jgi:hypothetical protein